MPPMTRVAVLGHVEWVTFARVDAVPPVGGIAHATETWEGAAGGGAVAALQLAKLAGSCDLFTALGDDELGRRARVELEGNGVTVYAATRDDPTRKAICLVDGDGERTITTLGARLETDGVDRLPWGALREADGVYVTAGDADAIREARAARVLVVSLRHLDMLARSEVRPDAVVGSARDPAEPLKLTAGELAGRGVGLDPVERRAVQPEDLRLPLLRQERIAVPLPELLGDLERPQRLDQRLR